MAATKTTTTQKAAPDHTGATDLIAQLEGVEPDGEMDDAKASSLDLVELGVCAQGRPAGPGCLSRTGVRMNHTTSSVGAPEVPWPTSDQRVRMPDTSMLPATDQPVPAQADPPTDTSAAWLESVRTSVRGNPLAAMATEVPMRAALERMRHRLVKAVPARAGALLLTALALSACNKAPPVPPASPMAPPQVEAAPASVGGSDQSVPDAASVVTPSAGARADPAAGRTNGAMSPGQESSAMPMPGQNNDHSAPAAPARRASAP